MKQTLIVIFLIFSALLIQADAKFTKKARHHLRNKVMSKKFGHRHRLHMRHKQDTTTASSSSSTSSSTSTSTATTTTTTTTTSTKSTKTTQTMSSTAYPQCETGEISDPCLNQYMPVATLAAHLVTPDFPKDKCVTPNASENSGGDPINGRVEKHLELLKRRITVGYAAYFFDQTDHFLLADFEADVKESWKAFWANAMESHRGDEEIMNGGIDRAALEKTITESKWQDALTTDYVKLIREYSIESDKLHHNKFDEVKTILNLQELTYLNIFENIRDDMDQTECENCFKKTKTQIEDFFKYLDCNNDGLISAENTYIGMKNMKKLQYEHTKTTMVNTFFLNSMEHTSAGLDLVDFQYALLTGMMERVVTPHAMTEIEINSMKVARRDTIKDGGGPGRR